MEISYFGHSSFKIKGKSATLITDPFNLKAEANIVTVSQNQPDNNDAEKVQGNPFIISGPGEYEIKGIAVLGFPTKNANTIYLIEMDGLHLLHLGNLTEKIKPDQLEEVEEGVDVLFLPVGGTQIIGPKEAVEVISAFEPKIVIPMSYEDVQPFLKEFGEEVSPQAKLVINKDSLPEERKVIVLEQKS